MIVQGNVQGVGFRYFTKQVADELNICGSVKNMDDGTVYCEAMGPKEKIDVFIQKVRESPSSSGHVTNLNVEEDSSLEESESFEIAY